MAGNDSIYHLSRALYRRLAPLVVEDERASGSRNRQRVLDACEHTMKRLAEEPDFARPGRFLFEQIRVCFPISEQRWVRRLIDVHVRLARPLAEELRDAEGRRCSAYSRLGMPCRREARAGSAYCPSHRHLELVSERSAS